MNLIIKKSLDRSLSYEGYRSLVHQLSELHSTTGEKTKPNVDFTRLNDRRMKRWDKTLKITDVDQKSISRFPHKITWLVLAESWCGDGAHVIPVLNKIALLNPKISLKIVLRDENPELMDAFLTNGSRAIPKVIIIDDATFKVLGTYGPHPSEVTVYIKSFKAVNKTLTKSFKEDLQHWYNNNKGQNIIKDIIEILGRFEPSVSQ